MAGSNIVGPMPQEMHHGMLRQRGSGRLRRLAGSFMLRLACGAAAAVLAATAGLAQDKARMAAGEDAWDKAGCLQCHGAEGEGGSGGEFPAGPSLRKTRLDRAGLVETVSCGLPGTAMPAWLDGAYAERPCYGFTAPPDGTTVTPVLSAAEVEALVDYLLAKMVGK
jgi:mono/diheme cytochrome c family protein